MGDRERSSEQRRAWQTERTRWMPAKHVKRAQKHSRWQHQEDQIQTTRTYKYLFSFKEIHNFFFSFLSLVLSLSHCLSLFCCVIFVMQTFLSFLILFLFLLLRSWCFCISAEQSNEQSCRIVSMPFLLFRWWKCLHLFGIRIIFFFFSSSPPLPFHPVLLFVRFSISSCWNVN